MTVIVGSGQQRELFTDGALVSRVFTSRVQVPTLKVPSLLERFNSGQCLKVLSYLALGLGLPTCFPLLEDS